MEEVQKFICENMTCLQDIQAEAANQYRKNVTEKYKVSNMVWLSTKNIKTEKPLKKLNHKMISPFQIKKSVFGLCRLDLPTTIKIYDVFYSTLLQKTAKNPLLGQHNNFAPLVIIDEEREWEIDDILNAKRKKKARKSSFESNRKTTIRTKRGTMPQGSKT